MASAALSALASPRRAPEGYTRFLLKGADVVALNACADAVRQSLVMRTLYGYASNHPKRRAFDGRVPAYAVLLPDGVTRVVVRHSHHGGMFAALSGDRFLAPTRAPHELDVALRLAHENVPTPQVIAYAVYPAGPLLQRADVATREITGGRDLADLFAQPLAPDDRRAALDAVIVLLRLMTAAGARHPDLNLKNILLVPREGLAETMAAYVIDVDRIAFHTPGDGRIADGNVRRLVRSARKWRDQHALPMDESDLALLATAATPA